MSRCSAFPRSSDSFAAVRALRTVIPLLLIIAIPVVMNSYRNYVVRRDFEGSNVFVSHEAAYKAANEAKFNSLFDAGQKSLQSQQFDDALASFKEAEQSAPRLTDTQYSSLQGSRRQIAQIYETLGRPSDAETAYTSIFNSSLQQANELGCTDTAVIRLQDAELIAQKLTQNRLSSLLRARSGLVSCLRILHRYYEAEDVSLRMIDFLRQSSDQYDPNLADNYVDLAQTRSLQSDWKGAEEALLLAKGQFDNTLQHLSSPVDSDRIAVAAFGRCKLLVELANVYEHDGDADRALATVEDLFQFSSQYNGPSGEREPLSLNEIAFLGMHIAAKAQRHDLEDLWRQRLQTQQTRRRP